MKAYRVDTGYKLPHNTTALHIVQHEETELGNDILYPTISKSWLGTVPAWRCMWFTKTVEDALRYGDLHQVDEYDLYDFEVIAEDGDGGYLIVVRD